ncbi:MAG: molybdopterin-dependent oxidoreductase [Clostridiales bacterium]
MAKTELKKTICPYDCPTSCGLLAETDGQTILSIAGDPGHPATKGLICRKMRHYEKSIHAAGRIMTPLRRTGAKGEGLFTPISWQEAVAEIRDNWLRIIEEQGPQGILPMYYSGVMSLIQRNCGDAFFNRMGACSLVKTLCSSAKQAGYAAVMGKTGCLDPRELRDSDYYIIWGCNMKATQLQSLPEIIAGRRAGKKTVLIETWAEDMAAYCDQTILIKPGTDGALALAMMNVLITEGLADEAFLLEQALGFAEFKASLYQYTPAWAEGITGIPAATIAGLAREYAAAKAPAIILGSGNSRYGNGGMTVRLITILSAFTGAWRQPGGGLCGCNPGNGQYVDIQRITRPDFRTNRPRKVNINQLASALNGTEDSPAVKSLFVYGGNPVGSVSNQAGIIKGLLRPDIFTVVHERFMTDTAKYADIILPAAFSVEQSDCYNAYGYCTFGVARRIISPPGQCKSNWDTFCHLAKVMGYAEDYFQQTEEEMLDDLLSHPLPALAAISAGDRETLRQGAVINMPFADHLHWQTQSGKMQIVNEDLDQPLPRYLESHGGPYPLRLVSVPSGYTLNSIFLERPELLQQRGLMILALHPEDAASRDISDNDSIVAFNDLAEVGFMARVTDKVAKGTAAAPGIYTRSASRNGLLVNALHHERLSDIAEATTMNDNTIEVKKA